MPPIDPEPNEEEKLQKLDQDFDKPFSPPSDAQSSMSNDSGQTSSGADSVDPSTTHPATDTNLDAAQVYDEGAAGAAEMTGSEDTNLEPGEKIA